MGKGCFVPFFRFHSQKPTSKRRFSKCVSDDYSCSNYHCRQFKEDRTLCPVRALRFYLDRTKDVRGSQSLLFISFKKGHTSDIRPAILSSWLKQTILLCYKQADQQALDLVQVKAHDIRAFAASKAFYGGVSVESNHASVSLESSPHICNFLPKRPDLVRQRPQHVSGTSSSGTTSPRPFPSAYSSLRREKRGGTPAAAKSSGVYPRV